MSLLYCVTFTLITMCKSHDKEVPSQQAKVIEPSTSGYYCSVEHLPRQVPHVLSARSVGVEPQLNNHENRLFKQIGVCFIIKGTGLCHEDDRSWNSKGPCVLFQWPGHHYRHDPDTTCEAFYLTFNEKYMTYFESSGWADFRRSYLPLPDAQRLRNASTKLLGLCKQLGHFGSIDAIDHFCEQMLLEVLTICRQNVDRAVEDRLDHVKEWIDAHCCEEVNVDTLARRNGFSPRSFWRQWRQRFGSTPLEYLTDLRMTRACELLASNNLSVHQVATQVGYEDPYYFSRRFHKIIGSPPSTYCIK